ncbi:MAG: LptA/OstA family protein [Gammaproteobacteria bacterium]|jgi:lipopolysaccharide transport protein LptA
MIKKILSLLVVSSLYAGESDDLVINSDKVNIANNDKVIFSENISIDSGLVLINADMAIYDNDTKIIEITGNPSSLKSLDNKKDFFGSASKIVFYNNEKVHLVGNAKMKYENMTISSEKIIFSPSTGFIESN